MFVVELHILLCPQSKEDLSSFALPHLGGDEKVQEQLNLDQEVSGKKLEDAIHAILYLTDTVQPLNDSGSYMEHVMVVHVLCISHISSFRWNGMESEWNPILCV